MATQLTVPGLIVKWVFIPGALAAVGYFLIGAKLGQGMISPTVQTDITPSPVSPSPNPISLPPSPKPETAHRRRKKKRHRKKPVNMKEDSVALQQEQPKSIPAVRE